MFTKLLFLPITLFVCGLYNHIFLEKNGEVETRMISQSKNKAHKIYDHGGKLKLFTIEDFELSTEQIRKNKQVRITYKGAPWSDTLRLKYKVYNSNGKLVSDTSFFKDRYETMNDTITTNFENVEMWNGLMRFEFTWFFDFSSKSGTFGEFELFFGSGKFESPNFDLRMPYRAEIYPSDGYSEVFGDYIRINNLKEIYEIPYYGKFSFNDIGLEIYMETTSPSSLRGQVAFLDNNVPEKLVGDEITPEDREMADFYYNKMFNFSLVGTDRDDTKKIVNNKTFYYDPNTYAFSMNRNDKCTASTKDFYFPLKLYPYLKEVHFDICLVQWTKGGFNLTIPINIRFLQPFYITDFEVVGEIENEIIDEDLEEVIIP